MSAEANKVKNKTPKAVISFRFGTTVKSRLENTALKQNLDPSDVYSQVFAKGLEAMYGYKIEGKELVE